MVAHNRTTTVPQLSHNRTTTVPHLSHNKTTYINLCQYFTEFTIILYIFENWTIDESVKKQHKFIIEIWPAHFDFLDFAFSGHVFHVDKLRFMIFTFLKFRNFM